MVSKIWFETIRFLTVCVFGVIIPSTFAQSSTATTARLFIRYESVASLHRLNEDVLSLTSSVPPNSRATIAIRICSQERLGVALPAASANPFWIADSLINKFAYPNDRITYLRASECAPKENPSLPVTEIWTVPQDAPLPPYDEAAASGQVKLQPLGKVTTYPGMRDYKVATSELIKRLKSQPKTFGVVVGYYFSHPSQLLQRRLEDVKRVLQNSGLSMQQYSVRAKLWDDEVSAEPRDPEPVYPSIFLVEIGERK